MTALTTGTVPLLAWAAAMCPAALAAPPAEGWGVVRSVFAPGEGRNLSPPEAAAVFAGAQAPPASYRDQLPLFEALLYAEPHLTSTDLDRSFKPATLDVAADQVASRETPAAGVRIVRDAFGVAHVDADTRAGVMFGSGYVQGEDRLFQMEVLRAGARGRAGELLGPHAIAQDVQTLRAVDISEAHLQRAFDGLAEKWGSEGRMVQDDIRQYVAGINAYLDAAQLNPLLLPGELVALGRPAPNQWTVTDVAAVNAFTQAGVDLVARRPEYEEAELRARLERKLGASAGDAVFADFRRSRDPEAPVITTSRFSDAPRGPLNAAAVAVPDIGSLVPYDPLQGGTAPAPPAGGIAASTLAYLSSSHSNAVLVAGRHTRSGHPIAEWGPQGGLQAPHTFLNEVALSAPGIRVRGISDTGTGPWVSTAGRGVDYAWSNTNSYSDLSDDFAERLCEPDESPPTTGSDQYAYRGRCTPFVDQEIRYTTTNPIDPSPPQTVVLRARRSVHGPVEATGTVAGAPVALALGHAAGFQPLGTWITYERMDDAVHDAASFERAIEPESSATTWFYADDRDIAFATGGTSPVRAPGVDRDAPTWGTGQFDWRGFDPANGSLTPLPARRRPHGINPSSGVIASWNTKSARSWRPQDGAFQYGPIQRVQMLARPLAAAVHAGKVGEVDVARIYQQAATRDLRAFTVYRWLRRVIT